MSFFIVNQVKLFSSIAESLLLLFSYLLLFDNLLYGNFQFGICQFSFLQFRNYHACFLPLCVISDRFISLLYILVDRILSQKDAGKSLSF